MPTLLGLSGLPVPESVQGTNFAPVIEGKRKVDSEAASLLNLPVTFFSARRAGFAEYRGLRTQRHTYVRSIQGPWLLYDNQQDPYQKQNLVERNVALRSRLDRKLDSMLRRIGDEFLPGKTYAERAQASHYKEVVSPIGKTVSPWGDWRSTIE
jgi:arylsulfatase A-like enzyme